MKDKNKKFDEISLANDMRDHTGADMRDAFLRVKKGFLESFVYLSMHREFKEELIKNKTGILDKFFTWMFRTEDLQADASFTFLYPTVVFNFFRSSEDKIRPRMKEYPYNELDDEQASALEKFWEKMPDESKPAQNGVLDVGDAELAFKYRQFF